MEAPIRVQRKRTKGFKLPPNTVCVNRPTKWGNPFNMGREIADAQQMLKKIGITDKVAIEVAARESAIHHFELHIRANEGLFIEIKSELKGKNLACFCPVDKPCHADVLLRYANEE